MLLSGCRKVMIVITFFIFPTYIRTSKFHRIFGSYRFFDLSNNSYQLLTISKSTSELQSSVCRITHINFCRLRKVRQNFKVPSNFLVRIFWFISHINFCRFRKIHQNFKVPSNFWLVSIFVRFPNN